MFKNKLTNLNQERDQVTREIAELKYTEVSTRALQVNEVSIEEYIRLVDKVLAIIYAARQKRMHPGL